MIMDHSTFLTKSEIFELTGYKQSAKQIQWLKKAGIRFTINRYERPIVLKKHIEDKLCDAPSSSIKKTEPDEKALRQSLGLH